MQYTPGTKATILTYQSSVFPRELLGSPTKIQFLSSKSSECFRRFEGQLGFRMYDPPSSRPVEADDSRLRRCPPGELAGVPAALGRPGVGQVLVHLAISQAELGPSSRVEGRQVPLLSKIVLLM